MKQVDGWLSGFRKRCPITVLFFSMILLVVVMGMFYFELNSELFALSNRMIAIPRTSLRPKECSSNNSAPAIVMESLIGNKLSSLGGTGHWFHLLERIVPAMHGIEKSSLFKYNNDVLYIVFKEKFAVDELNDFGRLMLTSTLSRGKFKKVVFGYSEKTRHFSVESTGIIKDYVVGFVVDFDKDSMSRFSEGSSSFFRPNSEICMTNVFTLSWNLASHARERMFSSSSHFLDFRTAVVRSCSLEKSLMNTTFSPKCHAQEHSLDVNDIISFSHKKKKFLPVISTVDDHGYLAINSLPKFNDENCVSTNKIVVYQRDSSRKISNLNVMLKRLNQAIDTWNKKILSKETELRAPLWSLEVVVHSQSRPICELLSIISQASILISSHGFQSILLLFQPSKSSLVEVHPSSYFKPDVYGWMQLGIRSVARIPRGYFAIESTPKTWFMSFLRQVLFGLHFSSDFCLRYTICRYISRKQNVDMPMPFLNQMLADLEKYYNL